MDASTLDDVRARIEAAVEAEFARVLDETDASGDVTPEEAAAFNAACTTLATLALRMRDRNVTDRS